MNQKKIAEVPALKTIAMPADSNPNGDIFGGWLLSQMDLAGAVIAQDLCQGRVVTVAVDAMEFHKPVYIGDRVSCYAKMVKKGTTSMAIHIETWVERQNPNEEIKVTEGVFTYVSIDKNRRPKPIDN